MWDIVVSALFVVSVLCGTSLLGLAVMVAVGEVRQAREAMRAPQVIRDVEFPGFVMAEINAQSAELGRVLGFFSEDGKREVSREFGALAYRFYRLEMPLDEFRRVCAGLYRVR